MNLSWPGHTKGGMQTGKSENLPSRANRADKGALDH
jgi:hypothetical protein